MPPTQSNNTAPKDVPKPASASPRPATVQSGDTSKKSKLPVPVIAGVVGLVFIAGLLYMVMNRNNSGNSANSGQQGTPVQQPEKIIPTLDMTKPALSFNSAAGTTGLRANTEIKVNIKGNSQGADIYGYDLLFPYDKNLFEITQVKSLVEGFDIVRHDRGDYYAITGFKIPSQTNPTPFNDTEIIELTVVAKRPGTIYIELMPERGKESSKFVDKDIKIIQPQIQPIKLEIQ